MSSIPRLNDKNFLYDGILFYHKEAVYISGFTPLVTWLKPYMVPEVFGTEVNECYMEKKPKNYENFQEFTRKLSSQKDDPENMCEVSLDYNLQFNMIFFTCFRLIWLLQKLHDWPVSARFYCILFICYHFLRNKQNEVLRCFIV